MNNLVSVVIPTCGKNNYYEDCLRSVLAQTYRKIEIIVIDNSGDLALKDRILKVCPQAQVFSSPVNLYYCAGMNKGIALSRGDYLLCLNDDVQLSTDYIATVLQAFSRDSRVGMATGKILRMDRRTVDSTGLFLKVFRTARERGYGEPDKGNYDRDGYVFGVSGAVAFYSRRMLNELGGDQEWFDNVFRMFYEDLDLSWRAHNRGWRGYYVANAVAYHVRGGTVRSPVKGVNGYAIHSIPDELCVDLVKNRYLMIIKNESLLGFVLYLFPIIFYDLCLWGYLILCRPKVAWAVMQWVTMRKALWQRQNRHPSSF